jgi:hypothetical protein
VLSPDREVSLAKNFARLVGAALVGAIASSPSDARRVVVDFDTFDVFGDAVNGDVVDLAGGIDYGVGLQSQVVVGLPNGFPSSGLQSGATSTVGLGIIGAPGDSFFASLTNYGFNGGTPIVYLSNQTQLANVNLPPPNLVSEFFFGLGFFGQNSVFPVPPGEINENYVATAGAAVFQFLDLSASGVQGDFGLNLVCAEACIDIGFNLAGVSFSSSTFNPATAPAQLTSFSFGQGSASVTNPAPLAPRSPLLSQAFAGRESSSFSFVFRNAPSAVPEPGTWAMMLVGFGAVGWAMRRKANGTSCWGPSLRPLT